MIPTRLDISTTLETRFSLGPHINPMTRPVWRKPSLPIPNVPGPRPVPRPSAWRQLACGLISASLAIPTKASTRIQILLASSLVLFGSGGPLSSTVQRRPQHWRCSGRCRRRSDSFQKIRPSFGMAGARSINCVGSNTSVSHPSREFASAPSP